jgi:hypothetical protein
MMTCTTKELYDWDEKEEEENEQDNIGVRKRVRFHLFLRESTRRAGWSLAHRFHGGSSFQYRLVRVPR